MASAARWSSAPLGERVRLLIAIRRKRDTMFPAGLFADAARDILLELLASELEGRSVSISDACNSPAVPTTTALRCIQMLVKSKVLERTVDVNDRRRSLLRLSHALRLAMRGTDRPAQEGLCYRSPNGRGRIPIRPHRSGHGCRSMSKAGKKLAGLAALSPAQLREQWIVLYEAEPPRLPTDLMRLGLAYRLQERAG